MNILVTGANGQLAQCLKTIVDANFNGKPDHYVGEKNCYIFKSREDLDIGNLEEVRKTIKQEFINVIVNCAAYTNVNKAQEEQDIANAANCIGARNLAIAAKEVGAVLIQISTDYVFSVENKVNTPLPPFNFCDPRRVPTYEPVKMDDNYYGFSKLNAECAILSTDCKFIIIRTSWMYSAFGKNFVKTMFERLISGKDVKVVYDQLGSPTSAMELAAFIYHIIEKHGPDTRYLSKEGIYNFVGNGVASWYDIVAQMKLYLEAEYEMENLGNVTKCLSTEFQQPVKRPNYSVLDNSLIKSVFDFDINYWGESLYKVVDYLFYKETDVKKSEAIKNALYEAEKELHELIDKN